MTELAITFAIAYATEPHVEEVKYCNRFGNDRRLFGNDRRLFGHGRRLFGNGRRLFGNGRRLFGNSQAHCTIL